MITPGTLVRVRKRAHSYTEYQYGWIVLGELNGDNLMRSRSVHIKYTDVCVLLRSQKVVDFYADKTFFSLILSPHGVCWMESRLLRRVLKSSLNST